MKAVNRLKKLMLVLAVVALLPLFTVKAYAQEFNTAVRDSIAVVYTCIDVNGGGEESFGWGSGFFVGNLDEDPEYLVTNYHVIADYNNAGAGELVGLQDEEGSVVGTARTKIRVYYDSSDFVEAYIVDADPTKDLALLKLDKPTSKRAALPLCRPTEEMIGSTVYCVGYPGLSDNIFSESTSTWSKTDASVSRGTIGRLITISGTGVRQIQTDAQISPGNSGGPMVNANGSVVGVVVRGVASGDDIQATMYYAINVDELIPMLKLHDVPYVMEDEIEAPSSVNPIMIAGIAAAAVVVIVIIVIVIAKSKKKKKVAPETKEEPQAAVARKAYVRSLATQHNGAKFEITGGRVLIGRDPQTCNIVFSKNTPGISSKHCEIMWDSATGDFILVDLSSSYGTFLSNGQKLRANETYRLKSGDSFYLAENSNTIRVELE